MLSLIALQMQFRRVCVSCLFSGSAPWGALLVSATSDTQKQGLDSITTAALSVSNSKSLLVVNLNLPARQETQTRGPGR
eukprot:2544428-Amphidinium_carterae.1